MGFLNSIFNVIGIPIGWLFGWLYSWIGNYFICIFLLTLLIRIVLFPLSLKSQKSQADRAKLAPKLEHLQKKYSGDKVKLQEKTQAAYEKAGVSMTGGCAPLLIPWIVLMGFIFVVYSPLSYLSKTPTKVIDATVTAVTVQKNDSDAVKANKISANDAKNQYYRQLNTLSVLEDNKTEVIKAIDKLDKTTLSGKTGEYYYSRMAELKDDFNFFGHTVLDKPWTTGKGFSDINILWLIPLISGITAFLSMMLSMHYTKTAMGNQPGQGCTNGMMYIMMPGFSLYIAFVVPGAVGIYWICSNLIALLQTYILNQIYNPSKIRAQAEIEYAQRKKNKAEDKKKRLEEDKKRLAESRKREEDAAKAEVETTEKGKPAKKKAGSAAKPTDTETESILETTDTIPEDMGDAQK